MGRWVHDVRKYNVLVAVGLFTLPLVDLLCLWDHDEARLLHLLRLFRSSAGVGGNGAFAPGRSFAAELGCGLVGLPIVLSSSSSYDAAKLTLSVGLKGTRPPEAPPNPAWARSSRSFACALNPANPEAKLRAEALEGPEEADDGGQLPDVGSGPVEVEADLDPERVDRVEEGVENAAPKGSPVAGVGGDVVEVWSKDEATLVKLEARRRVTSVSKGCRCRLPKHPQPRQGKATQAATASCLTLGM